MLADWPDWEGTAKDWSRFLCAFRPLAVRDETMTFFHRSMALVTTVLRSECRSSMLKPASLRPLTPPSVMYCTIFSSTLNVVGAIILNSRGCCNRFKWSIWAWRFELSCFRECCVSFKSSTSFCLRPTLLASSRIQSSCRRCGERCSHTVKPEIKCSVTCLSNVSAVCSALRTASRAFSWYQAVWEGGYVSSSEIVVVAAEHATFHFRNSSMKYDINASFCLSPGGSMDQEVDVGCCVEENKVGGGLRHWRQSAGKSRDRGSNLNGIESTSTCCLPAALACLKKDFLADGRSLLGCSPRTDHLAECQLRSSCRVEGILDLLLDVELRLHHLPGDHSLRSRSRSRPPSRPPDSVTISVGAACSWHVVNKPGHVPSCSERMVSNPLLRPARKSHRFPKLAM